MTKRLISVCYLLLAAAAMLSAVSLNAEAESLPTSIKLSWDAVDGAVYYDLYEKNDFIIRLSSDVLSYRKNNLQSDTEYSFSIAARDEDNNTLDAAFIDVRTGSWDGLYEWINKTSKDNRGKMKNLMIRVETAVDSVFGQYHKLYMIMDDGSEVQIFPLYDFGDTSSGEWVNYKDTGRIHQYSVRGNGVSIVLRSDMIQDPQPCSRARSESLPTPSLPTDSSLRMER